MDWSRRPDDKGAGASATEPAARGGRPHEEVVVVVLTFDPFREMDRLAGQLFGDVSRGRGLGWMPMDLYRSGDHYVVHADLPGVDPGSIDVRVDGNTLTIRAQRSVRSEEAAQWLAQERPSGTFLRQLNLGEGLDVEKIDASYDAGVLTVLIPVSEAAKPRRIEVSAVGGRQEVESGRKIQGEVTSETAKSETTTS